MIHSVRREDGSYWYFEAPGQVPNGQGYDAPRGASVNGMYPSDAWDVRLPSGAKRTGDGALPKGIIAVPGGGGSSDGLKAGAVGIGGFLAGWLLGKLLR